MAPPLFDWDFAWRDDRWVVVDVVRISAPREKPTPTDVSSWFKGPVWSYVTDS